MSIVVSERKALQLDESVFHMAGLDPRTARIVLVKSAGGFRGVYEAYAADDHRDRYARAVRQRPHPAPLSPHPATDVALGSRPRRAMAGSRDGRGCHRPRRPSRPNEARRTGRPRHRRLARDRPGTARSGSRARARRSWSTTTQNDRGRRSGRRDHGGRWPGGRHPGDVSVAADVESIVAATVERFGALDILVNNAAMVEVHRPWTEITEEHWDQVQAVNVKGCFLCFRAAYPHLRASGHGRVINIASVTFWVGHDRLAHYVASKGGVIGFTRAISREVGAEGITVNAVTPGAIQTEAEQAVITDPEAFRDLVEHRQSIRRRGKPEDIVGAVLYLASDEASFVTGQTINVDGGWASATRALLSRPGAPGFPRRDDRRARPSPRPAAARRRACVATPSGPRSRGRRAPSCTAPSAPARAGSCSASGCRSSSTSTRRPRDREDRGELVGRLDVPVRDRDDDRLDRSEPEREGAREVLGEDADEPLERAVDRPVDGDRPLLAGRPRRCSAGRNARAASRGRPGSSPSAIRARARRRCRCRSSARRTCRPSA